MPGLQTSNNTSPAGSFQDAIHDPWEYAVPIEDEFGHGTTTLTGKSKKGSYPTNGGVNNRMNGYGPRNYDRGSVSRYPPDASMYLDTPGTLHRNGSTISSNQDGDSVLDLYGTRLSTVSAMSADTMDGRNGYLTDEDSKWIDSEKLARIEGEQQLEQEHSRWINKEKLEQIEIQELEQAGIRIPLKSKRGTFNIAPNGDQDAGSLKRQRTHSDSSSQQEDERYFDPDAPASDLRRSEQNSDSTTHPMRHGNRNGSSSRIPLPVRPPHKQRQVPLVRQQPSPEEGFGGEDGTYPATRKRSYSAGSAVLLNGEVESPAPSTKMAGSRASRGQSQSQTQGAASTDKNSKANPRLSKNTSLSKRSRSNPQLSPPHRPSTGTSSSHQAPEGPPPWSLSTYSPDPKLPPDQQLIPTVAKRLQQEQWEKEGKFATVYDGKLRPLKVTDVDNLQGPKANEQQEQKEEKADNEGNMEYDWPLKSPTRSPPPITSPPSPKPSSPKPEGKAPATDPHPAAPHHHPRTLTKMNGRSMSQTGPMKQFEPIKADIAGPDEPEKKKKKALCCCVVM